VSDGWIAAPVSGRLYLPERWTADWERRQAAGVPEEVSFATKPELALEILRPARGDGVPAAPVLGVAPTATTRNFAPGCGTWAWSFFCKSTGRRSRDGTARCGPRSSGFAVMSVRGSLLPRPWRS
jgi:DDE superfamily endonuclease